MMDAKAVTARAETLADVKLIENEMHLDSVSRKALSLGITYAVNAMLEIEIEKLENRR